MIALGSAIIQAYRVEIFVFTEMNFGAINEITSSKPLCRRTAINGMR